MVKEDGRRDVLSFSHLPSHLSANSTSTLEQPYEDVNVHAHEHRIAAALFLTKGIGASGKSKWNGSGLGVCPRKGKTLLERHMDVPPRTEVQESSPRNDTEAPAAPARAEVWSSLRSCHGWHERRQTPSRQAKSDGN